MAVLGDEETIYADPPSFHMDKFSHTTVRSPRHHLTTFHLTLVPFAHLCLYPSKSRPVYPLIIAITVERSTPSFVKIGERVLRSKEMA